MILKDILSKVLKYWHLVESLDFSKLPNFLVNRLLIEKIQVKLNLIYYEKL